MRKNGVSEKRAGERAPAPRALGGSESTRIIAPGIFHIHVDATELPSVMREYCIGKLGMSTTDFSGHPEGYRHFEPINHLTLKMKEGATFRRTWDALSRCAKESNFVGYLEGEYLTLDELLPCSPWRGGDVPFVITRRRLDSDRGEQFRETELHLTMDADRSSPELIAGLLRSGLYGAYLPKAGWRDLVLTAQGHCEEILPLITHLRRFIEQAGGAVGATLKEERVLRYELFGIGVGELPEVVDRVQYLSGEGV